MRNRLGYAIVATLLGANMLLVACDDDGDGVDNGGGGESAGGEPASGGSSSGKGGSVNGGSSGSTNGGMGGDMTEAGAGGMPEAGAGGMPEAGAGGAPGGMGGMAGANVGGADAGAGGGGTEVTYACGATSLNHKFCSALSAANCTEGVDCGDCVEIWTNDRSAFVGCDACLAHYDKVLQCSIDAFEGGTLSEGVVCLESGAESTFADPSEACWESFTDAVQCQAYWGAMDACPAQWPLPED